MTHEKKIVSSSLYPCLKTIESHLNGILKNGEYEFIKRALDGMMEKFKKYHQKVIDHALICHILDPRFKLFCIQQKDEKRNAKNLIENLFELYSINAKVDSQKQDSSNKSKKKESIVSLTQQYLAKVTKTKATNEDEIDRFFKKPQVEYCPNYDVLAYWKENKDNFPVLSLIAKDYLAIQVTSVPSERAFSGASETIQKKRTRLQTDTVHELLCLKSWLK